MQCVDHLGFLIGLGFGATNPGLSENAAKLEAAELAQAMFPGNFERRYAVAYCLAFLRGWRFSRGEK